MNKIQDTFMELLSHMRVLPDSVQGFLVNPESDSRTFLTGLYRREDGEAGCPVGFLIPDSEYFPELEGMVCISAPVEKILTKAGHSVAICTMAQRIHDMVARPDWESAMKAVAQTFNLKYSPPLGELVADASISTLHLLGNSLSSQMFVHLHEQVALENKLEEIEESIRQQKKNNPVVAAVFAKV